MIIINISERQSVILLDPDNTEITGPATSSAPTVPDTFLIPAEIPFCITICPEPEYAMMLFWMDLADCDCGCIAGTFLKTAVCSGTTKDRHLTAGLIFMAFLC